MAEEAGFVPWAEVGSVAKAAINNGYDMDIKNAVEMEANLFGVVNDTHDKKEGMSAFLEKRKEKNFTDF